jgi:hypothetical protein
MPSRWRARKDMGLSSISGLMQQKVGFVKGGVNPTLSRLGASLVNLEVIMDPIDEFARLKAEIQHLQYRAATLREQLLQPGARRRSNLHEIVIKDQVRRSFQPDLLPPELRNSPRMWTESHVQVVTVQEITDDPPVLVEPFRP